jgi:hypothetical protein
MARCKSVVKGRMETYNVGCVRKCKNSPLGIFVHISVTLETMESLYLRSEYLEAITEKMRQICHFMPPFSRWLNVKSDGVCIVTAGL